jgi:DNA polymerase III epsilon subunit-like protein
MEKYAIKMPTSGARHNAADDAMATLEVFMGMLDDMRRAGFNISAS